jgi:sugar/nucleoside kinase (ribokinase family)
MGLRAGLISRLGDDEFGKCIAMTLRGEGVDVSQIRTDKQGFTGVYFVQRDFPVPGRSKVFYYRKGSAASKLGPSDVDQGYVAASKLLYLTGITPALSSSCLAACVKAVELAKHSGLKVVFDTNIRPNLWLGKNPRKTLVPFIHKADVVFTDSSDARLLLGESNPAKAAQALMARGASIVVVKGGEKETVAYSGKQMHKQRAFKVPVVDPIGAGDAFAAVFVSGWLKGWGIKKCLAAGSAAGSLVVTRRGDQENIPTESDIADFLKAHAEDGE